MPIELSTAQQLTCVGRTLALKIPDALFSWSGRAGPLRRQARGLFTQQGHRGLLEGMQATMLDQEEMRRVNHFTTSAAFSQHLIQASAAGRIDNAVMFDLTSPHCLNHIDALLGRNAGAEVLVISHKRRPGVKRVEVVAGRQVHVLWAEQA